MFLLCFLLSIYQKKCTIFAFCKSRFVCYTYFYGVKWNSVSFSWLNFYCCKTNNKKKIFFEFIFCAKGVPLKRYGGYLVPLKRYGGYLFEKGYGSSSNLFEGIISLNKRRDLFSFLESTKTSLFFFAIKSSCLKCSFFILFSSSTQNESIKSNNSSLLIPEIRE